MLIHFVPIAVPRLLTSEVSRTFQGIHVQLFWTVRLSDKCHGFSVSIPRAILVYQSTWGVPQAWPPDLWPVTWLDSDDVRVLGTFWKIILKTTMFSHVYRLASIRVLGTFWEIIWKPSMFSHVYRLASIRVLGTFWKIILKTINV
jgi:hypothetical protein